MEKSMKVDNSISLTDFKKSCTHWKLKMFFCLNLPICESPLIGLIKVGKRSVHKIRNIIENVNPWIVMLLSNV